MKIRSIAFFIFLVLRLDEPKIHNIPVPKKTFAIKSKYQNSYEREDSLVVDREIISERITNGYKSVQFENFRIGKNPLFAFIVTRIA